MSGYTPWGEIKRKRPRTPERERERRRKHEKISRAYDVVRPVVELSERAGGRAVSAEELARVLPGPDAHGAAEVLGRLAAAVEQFCGALELRLVFPDLPDPDVAPLRLRPDHEPGEVSQ